MGLPWLLLDLRALRDVSAIESLWGVSGGRWKGRRSARGLEEVVRIV